MSDIRSTPEYKFRKWLVSAFCIVTGYRFRKSLLKEQDITGYIKKMFSDDDSVIRQKATASLTSVSALLSFTVAVLVLLVTWKEFGDILKFGGSAPSPWCVIAAAGLVFILIYLTFWCERYISKASVDASSDKGELKKNPPLELNEKPKDENKYEDKLRKMRCNRSILLILLLSAALITFLGLPSMSTQLHDIAGRAFPLAGAAMIVIAVFLLVVALECYDSASGWRGEISFHFHLATIASNSFILGVFLALTGLSLNLYLLSFAVGRLATASTLLVLVLVMEGERFVWDAERIDR